MIKATNQNFDNIVNSPKLVIVDFNAAWCGPCKSLGQTIAKLEVPYQNNVSFASCDIDNNGELVERFGIRSVPTMILFKDGEQVKKIVGAVSQQQLENEIKVFLQ